ncbi:hypothetical protein PHYSODRAFT_525450, partial [Phytophthora sojae]
RRSCTAPFHVLVLSSGVGAQNVDLAVELLLEVDEEVLEELRRRVLGARQEHAAVVGLEVHKVDHVSVAQAVLGAPVSFLDRRFFVCLPSAHVRQFTRLWSVRWIPELVSLASRSTES